MANRRMFSLSIVDTDKFLSLSPTAQNLYFHLGMHADDDGFLAKTRYIMRDIHATESDLTELFQQNYIIPFDSGVVAITDWNRNNQISPTRYHETCFREELTALLKNHPCYQPRPSLSTEARLDQDREEQSSSDQPSPDDCTDTMDLERFYSFWNAYPRKENMADARKVWQELHVTNELFETILDAVQWQKSSRKWTAENGKYIPLPANWLRKEAWKDELPTAQNSTTRDDFDWMDFTNALPE